MDIIFSDKIKIQTRYKVFVFSEKCTQKPIGTHEGFLKYIHNNNFYIFEPENNECCLQLFYVCDKIYWGCSYSLPNKTFEEMESTNVREIKEHDIKTFLRSMIEASVININQDIDEVLTWDIKDIFAMPKLIGY